MSANNRGKKRNNFNPPPNTEVIPETPSPVRHDHSKSKTSSRVGNTGPTDDIIQLDKTILIEDDKEEDYSERRLDSGARSFAPRITLIKESSIISQNTSQSEAVVPAVPVSQPQRDDCLNSQNAQNVSSTSHGFPEQSTTDVADFVSQVLGAGTPPSSIFAENVRHLVDKETNPTRNTEKQHNCCGCVDIKVAVERLEQRFIRMSAITEKLSEGVLFLCKSIKYIAATGKPPVPNVSESQTKSQTKNATPLFNLDENKKFREPVYFNRNNQHIQNCIRTPATPASSITSPLSKTSKTKLPTIVTMPNFKPIDPPQPAFASTNVKSKTTPLPAKSVQRPPKGIIGRPKKIPLVSEATNKSPPLTQTNNNPNLNAIIRGWHTEGLSQSQNSPTSSITNSDQSQYSVWTPSPRQEPKKRKTNRTMSPDRLTFKCDICPRKYACRQSLVDHLLCHQSPDGFAYSCISCSKGYGTKVGFHLHLKSKLHKTKTEIQNALCTFCGLNFKTKQDLEDHQAKQHFSFNL